MNWNNSNNTHYKVASWIIKARARRDWTNDGLIWVCFEVDGDGGVSVSGDGDILTTKTKTMSINFPVPDWLHHGSGPSRDQ